MANIKYKDSNGNWISILTTGSSSPGGGPVSWGDINGVPNWIGESKPSYDYSEILNPPTIPTTLPASDVSEWAKALTKPSYTAAEVGALSTSGGSLSGALSITSETYRDFIKMTRSSVVWEISPSTDDSGSLRIVKDGSVAAYIGSTKMQIWGSDVITSSGGTIAGTLYVTSPTTVGTVAVRKVSAGTSNPSGGSDGDVYIKYT